MPGGYICQLQLCVVGQVSLGTKAGWSSPLSQGSGTTGVIRESAQNSCHPSGCQADLRSLVGVPSFPTAPKVVSSQALSFQRKRNTLVGPSPQVHIYSAPSDLKCSLAITTSCWFNSSVAFPGLMVKVLHDPDRLPTYQPENVLFTIHPNLVRFTIPCRVSPPSTSAYSSDFPIEPA